MSEQIDFLLDKYLGNKICPVPKIKGIYIPTPQKFIDNLNTNCNYTKQNNNYDNISCKRRISKILTSKSTAYRGNISFGNTTEQLNIVTPQRFFFNNF